MRRVFLWVLGGTTLAVGLWSCVKLTCEDYATCPGAGGQVTPGTSVNDGSAAVDGSVFPVGCEASPSGDARVLRDECGVFVQQGATGDGSKATPMGSVRDAVAKAAQQKKNRVYVCMGEYQEEVVIENAPVSIFGGLSCGDWAYDAAKRPRVSTPGQGKHALKVDGARPVQIEDMRFAARDGVTEGESSIAVFVVNAKITVRRTEISAGQGAAGANGATPPVNARLGQTGAMATATAGANGTTCSNCTLWGRSQGGSGGQASDGGTATPGQAGTSDPPAPAAAGRDGAGGVGWPELNNKCDTGYEGAPGLARQGGAGASAMGTISTHGWIPMSGAAGEAGNPGQGGGGGGGGQPGDLGGGQGGCGGCGGSGGLGGSGGGASVALLLVATEASLEALSLLAKDAGNGGAGSKGENGLAGGGGGAVTLSCSGGKGGSGAGGGGGGGGAGGISVGILYQGNAPIVDGQTLADAPTSPFVTLGQAGTGGAGGEGGTSGPNGVPASKGAAGTAGINGVRHAIRSM